MERDFDGKWGLAACLLAVLTPPCAAAAPTVLPAGHMQHPQVTRCDACHTEDIAAAGKVLETQSCLECHDQEQVDAKLQRLAQLQQEASSPAEDENTAPITGMGVPRYYEQTRIGADPNPMVLIPAGEFVMGTDERLSDEGPQHRVQLPAYSIDIYEVTNLQYKKFIDATGHKSPQHFENRNYPPGKVDHPVVYVSWMDAQDYCQWAGKRLPTDQEWEKAARGSDGRRFPWGMEFSLDKANTPMLWKERHEQGGTLPVGAFEGGKSPYGLYDMSGNVWEWTASWYEAYPGNTRPTQNYGQTYKTLKGGSWWDCSFYQCGISAPSYNRAFFLKSTRNESFGFRCAKDQ